MLTSEKIQQMVNDLREMESKLSSKLLDECKRLKKEYGLHEMDILVNVERAAFALGKLTIPAQDARINFLIPEPKGDEDNVD